MPRDDEQNWQVLDETTAAIAEAPDFESALGETLRRLGEHIGWEYGEAWAPVDADNTDELELKTTWNALEDSSEPGLADRLREFIESSRQERYTPGEGLPGRAWTDTQLKWIGDLFEPDWYRRTDLAAKVGFRSALAVPVPQTGDPVAILIWYTRRRAQRDETPVQLGEALTARLGSLLHLREVEQALREERDRFEMIASNVAEVFWLSAPDKSELHYVNPSYERVWGRPTEELYEDSTAWLDGIHPEDRPRVEREARRQAEGGYDEEYRVVRPDGEIRWVHDRAYPIRDGGEVVRIVGVAQDVTDRKRAERRLRKSERKFSTAFRMNPLAMAIVTFKERRFIDVNEGFCQLTGYSHDELIGKSIGDFDLWASPVDRRNVAHQIDTTGSVREFETTLRRADGEIRDVTFSGQPIEVDRRPCLLSATRDITDRKRYERELQRHTFRDVLTGLANRSLFRDRLEHALDITGRGSKRVAVAFIDIDRFKIVNDTLGHTSGDELLGLIADRLRDYLPDQVTVARFGSDEFVLLFEQVDDLGTVKDRCEDMLKTVTEPCELGGTIFHPTLSVGIAGSGPEAHSAEELLRFAEVAVSKSKTREGSFVSCYDPERDSEATEQLHRENALRRAVDHREFINFYQPVVDLETGELAGVEALVRWKHADRGLVSPADFISLAEETGLIVPIGDQVLQQALRDGADWLEQLDQTGVAKDFRLAVNLSARQYREPGLVERIRTLADDAGFPLESLVLEITESILVTGHGKLQQLREEGVRVAIDDFGTGYSSLHYLRRLEADELKIDRSFISELGPETRERVLVEAMLMMGKKCGLTVIAEGVETDHQRRQLIELGGTLAQGYYFARPMSAGDLAAKFIADQ